MNTHKVALRLYQPDDWPAVNRLSVGRSQQKYVATIDELFRKPKVHWRYHVIESNPGIVGFFCLDLRYWVEYDFARHGEFGIRSFFIDKHHQGHGYARAAVKQLTGFIAAHYPECRSLCLTVNCQNHSAYRCYEAGGFQDTDMLYLGGRVGPQHIMRLNMSA